jgi:hypothetical protein
MKKMIRYIVMFALGFFGVWALKQVGITPRSVDGEMNWLVAVAIFVTVVVMAGQLDKPLKKLTGEIQ